MSSESERDSKTEEPTEKRRLDALEREGGPSSREAGSAVALLVISAFLGSAAPALFTGLAHSLAIFIEDPGNWRLDNGEDAIRLLFIVCGPASRFVGVFIAAICVAAIAAAVLQNTPRLLLNRIAPDFSRISPSAGLGRLFGSQSVIELVKGFVKIAVAAFAAYVAIGGVGTAFIAIHSPPDAIPELVRQLCLRAVFFCALMACLVAAADVFLTRREWRRNLMMTKQEVKDELKQAEGDATLKSRLRAIARSRIRRRMMANVPKATVVVTNPTHYAVALRYVRQENSAPKVLAKGQDNIALKIREIAERHNIPVIENKSLARSLFDYTKIDQLIPPEFYKAVAEIIIYIESKKRQARHRQKGVDLNKPPGRK